MAYHSEKAPSDPDIADSAGSGFFSSDFKKHGDLKSMLDGSKDNLKLEAMKRIISIMADGRDVSELFPAVVKNVVSKNVEIKKLVYVYLVRYAEEQQDLALLSISTFQKGLKDPNQLIRASALRVLSSIRVPVIAPIMMLSIKEGVNDMSPFVRKTAAHAIPKLYSLDPDQKECLIEVIEKLLKDKTTLVAGSAVMAFEEVCPDRIDLIHKNYRKLCNLLVDIDEWGQVAVIHMLTRYARTQFLDPNKDACGVADEAFYPKSGSSDEEAGEEDEEKPKKQPYIMDPDHRLLLRTCKPLLQSRNSAVVVAVARLYHHCSPANEVGIVSRALVRLLRSHKEVQTVVLSNVATMSAHRKGMFEPYLKSFFVHANDPTHIRLLKLEIMTNVAGETSIGTILREFQSYITSSDKQFVAATIQAIGRCASNISEVTDTCLAGLVRLLSNRDEVVVAESVVVIKKLLQLKPKGNSDIIAHMARLVDNITVPMARASILWLLGEYAERVPKIAPDVLRNMAKTFGSEEDIVKLQILNLATKLSITNPKQTKLLCQYVLNLGKYDQNYDVRDRVRFLRQLILPNELAGQLSKHSKKIFLASKPPPVIESVFKERHSFQLGSLSHMINAKSSGYQELPDFPDVAPDSSVRNVEVEPAWGTSDSKTKKLKNKSKKSSFYSDSESSESESDSESGSETESESGSGSEEESGSDSGSESSGGSASESESEEESNSEDESEEDTEKSGSEESSEETSGSDSEEEIKPKKAPTSKSDKNKAELKRETQTKKSQEKSHEQLLDLNDIGETPNSTPISKSGSFLTPTLASEIESLSLSNDVSANLAPVAPSFTPGKSYELLHRITGKGLGTTYKFTRSPCIFSTSMVSVEVVFTNTTDNAITNIHIGDKRLGSGMNMHEFQEIGSLAAGASIAVTLGIDFKDTTQPANFDLCTENSKFAVSIKPPTGELLRGCTMSEQDFLSRQAKLRGMNESSLSAVIPSSKCKQELICRSVTEVANLSFIPCVTASDSEGVYRFAAKTVSQGVFVLVTVKVSATGGPSTVIVNCETMVLSSMLVKELKLALQ